MKKKILVIEDHPLVRNIISEMLTAEGYEVIAAGDGHTGLELIQTNKPGLILCDYHMPEFDGLQVLAGVRAAPHSVDIPFILMSIDESGNLAKRCLGAGANAFVAKGNDDVKFLETIRKVLEQTTRTVRQTAQVS